MLDILSGALDESFSPFYMFGTWIWNLMMSLIGMTSVQTPMSFSSVTWSYIGSQIYPWMSAIGATLLNISFYIGHVRQTSNLKENMTLEIFVESCIKVVLGNLMMVLGPSLMKLMFTAASAWCSNLLLETPIIYAQEDSDLGSAMFYGFFGIIFFIVCIVCAGMIFMAVYGRFLQLYLLVATEPIAMGTLPGGRGMSQTAFAWLRTFLAKTFEIVLIALTMVIAAKMCTALDFGSLDEGIVGVFDGAIQALQNMCIMVLMAATVKGMDAFMKRTFAL